MCASAATAQAQDDGFSIDRRPALLSPSQGLFVPTTRTLGHLGVSGQLALDYAHAPVVLSTGTGDARENVGAIVDHSMTLYLDAAIGFADFAEVGLSLPIALVRAGDSPSIPGYTDPSRGAALGDIVLAGTLRPLGPNDPPADGVDVALAVGAAVSFPSGSAGDLAGDGGFGGGVTLVATLLHASVLPQASLGVRFRPESTFVNVTVGHELTYSLGARVPIAPVEIEAAIRGAFTLVGDQSFESLTSPFELVAGADVSIASIAKVGLGLGLGLTDAVGMPDVRATLRVALFTPRGASDGEDDSDEDEDAHPTEGDADGDSILDGEDFCPDRAETLNQLADDDGCPDGVERTETHIVLTPPLVYEEGDADVTDEMRGVLELVVNLLESDETIRFVQIEGFATVDEDDPVELSEQRAQRVQSWLIERGIAEDRLSAVGIGAAQPLDDAPPEESRRVEFRILDI
jgi:outer membrane protein OmpA-like peptidoglycan-associated protein